MTVTGNARDAATLRLIAATLAQAARLAARGRTAFDRDEAVRLAAAAVVSRLGEAAARLSTEFRAKYPDVAWRKIIGARNIVAHEYHRIDYDTVWETLVTSMPDLAAELEADLRPLRAPGDSGGAGADASQQACGKVVQSTALPCLLKPGHAGRCRSRLT